MKKWILFAALFSMIQAGAQNHQDSSAYKLQTGMELDVLPYALGGYFGAAWIGKDHVRLRVLTANVHKPDITTNSAFTHHHIYAYALVADYFLHPRWQGWWLGAGPVYWKSNIQSKSSGARASFDNWLLNGSIGYHFRISNILYCSPWGGLSLRVAGDQQTAVGTERFTLPLLNPEVSVKFGLVF